jgi:hypothetical protein
MNAVKRVEWGICVCQAMKDIGTFDPALCPLLQGLSPEQAAEKMKDPIFANCRASLETDMSPTASKSTGSANCILDDQFEPA